MENCLPFTDGEVVVLVHRNVHQAHLLALYTGTSGYTPRLLNAKFGILLFSQS